MSHISVLDYQGHPIVRTRFPKGTDLNGIRTILTDTSFVYAQLTAGPILALVDFDNQVLDQPKLNLIEAVAKANSALVDATAIVGVAESQKDLYRRLLDLMHRNAALCDDEDQALGWLVSESEALKWLTAPQPPLDG